MSSQNVENVVAEVAQLVGKLDDDFVDTDQLDRDLIQSIETTDDTISALFNKRVQAIDETDRLGLQKKGLAEQSTRLKDNAGESDVAQCRNIMQSHNQEQVTMFRAISQPKPGDKTIYTARIAPNSVLARQSRMDADLQGPNPTGRLIDASNTGKVDPRRRAARRDRDSHNRGSRRRGRDRSRRGGRDHRRPNATNPAEAETEELEQLEKDMADYFGEEPPSNAQLTNHKDFRQDSFMPNVK
ncbi:hypothetical protein F5Y01DRAFT_320336 [Xylaria sp. FL0043]|nr:hypothetical protein F5Y01DRAFT_320336 [Xylaria sp. FL0043]